VRESHVSLQQGRTTALPLRVLARFLCDLISQYYLKPVRHKICEFLKCIFYHKLTTRLARVHLLLSRSDERVIRGARTTGNSATSSWLSTYSEQQRQRNVEIWINLTLSHTFNQLYISTSETLAQGGYHADKKTHKNPCELDLWPITLIFDTIVQVVEVHVRAKSYQVKCSGSWVIIITKKTQLKTILPALPRAVNVKSNNCFIALDCLRVISNCMYLLFCNLSTIQG